MCELAVPQRLFQCLMQLMSSCNTQGTYQYVRESVSQGRLIPQVGDRSCHLENQQILFCAGLAEY